MLTVAAQWLLGTVLVSWRYLWMTTPLHRTLAEGDSEADLPPALPAHLVDESVQLAASGVGAMFHRRFTVHIAGAHRSAEDLIRTVAGEFHRFVPREVVTMAGHEEGLALGRDCEVRMPGPWNGPVRVVEVTPRCIRLATRRGHLEAGQVQFRAWPEDDDLTFEVETWARCASWMIDVLYTHLRLAKEVQFNMWVRFCLSAAKIAGGRPRDGVHVSTRHLPESRIPFDRMPDGRIRVADGPVVPVQVFPFRFVRSYRIAAAPFGIGPTTSDVTVTPDELRVRFGPWRVRTPRTNIASITETGGMSWIKTAGPAHVSFADRGVTFATNGDRAVCLLFHDPVSVVDPTGHLRHPGLTLTVADTSGLAALLQT